MVAFSCCVFQVQRMDEEQLDLAWTTIFSFLGEGDSEGAGRHSQFYNEPVLSANNSRWMRVCCTLLRRLLQPRPDEEGQGLVYTVRKVDNLGPDYTTVRLFLSACCMHPPETMCLR